jgi:Ca2+/Na+ antiporter
VQTTNKPPRARTQADLIKFAFQYTQQNLYSETTNNGAHMFSLLDLVISIFLGLGLIMLAVAFLGASFAKKSHAEIIDPKNNWNGIKFELENRYRVMQDLCHLDSVSKSQAATSKANSNFLKKEEKKHSSNPNATTKEVKNNLEDLDFYPKDPLINGEMVMVDLLIEKAQRKLSERSASYFNSGVLMYVFSICMICAFSLFTYLNTEISYTVEQEIIKSHLAAHNCAKDPIANPEQRCENLEAKIHKGMHPDPVGTYGELYHFIFDLMKKVVAGGALLGAAYVIAATANSCFRESTILLHRRHLLRYIRLMSYENKGKVDNKDLRDIFGVDQAATTGFDKIKVESLRDNLVGKLIEAIGRLGSDAYQSRKRERSL